MSFARLSVLLSCDHQFHIVELFTIKVLACYFMLAFDGNIKSCQIGKKFVSINQNPDMRKTEKIESLLANGVDSL